MSLKHIYMSLSVKKMKIGKMTFKPILVIISLVTYAWTFAWFKSDGSQICNWRNQRTRRNG